MTALQKSNISITTNELSKSKLCFIHKLVFDYRVSFYRMLGGEGGPFKGRMDIQHSGKRMLGGLGDPEEVQVQEWEFAGLRWQWLDLYRVRRPGIVVALFDVHYVSSVIYCLSRPRDVIWVWWGIGFGSSRIANWIRVVLAQMADGTALYMPRAVKEFANAGVSRSLLFCAPNTIHVSPPPRREMAESARRNLVFFGGLKPRKRVDLLLEAYACVRRKGVPLGLLEIVGDGECLPALRQQVEALDISDAVLFHGNLYDGPKLTEVFGRSLAMVSPGQAGLSILHCFAYGVPVVVAEEAISGGELDNITDLKNGIIYGPKRAFSSLEIALRWVAENRAAVLKMGEAAATYYAQNMTIEHLLKAFSNGLDRASKSHEGKIV